MTRAASIILLAGMLCACTRIPAANVVPATALNGSEFVRHGHADSSKFKTIFTFNGKNGSAPSAGLIVVNGVLYGTTAAGGSGGHGTVFSLTTSGKEKILHNFSFDGSDPQTTLLAHNGVLYGTTGTGPGSSGVGSVFAMKTDGTELWAYLFNGGSGDGALPLGGLIAVNGKLYGTTYYGGSKNAGTVYEISTGGKEQVIYSFRSLSDGEGPWCNLIPVKGTLYGTTEEGGKANRGTVFSVTTSGAEKVIYAFKNSADGYAPVAGLVTLGGVTYGTTENGGKTGEYGTVFKITADLKEQILHTFSGGTDGEYPEAPLIAYNGNLYGTTINGGTDGDGTVFEITPEGKEQVLHAFTGQQDGEVPDAGLVELNGVLYGTTYGGYGSQGTVFAITP